MIVGKTSGTGVKMSVIKFDLSEIQALQYDKNIWIYESNVFLTVKKSTSDGTNWKNQVTKLHRVAKPWDEIITNTGQLTSEQNIDKPSTGEFNELTRNPTRDRKLWTSFTETIHQFVSPYNKNKNEDYYGVALVNHYTDGSQEDTDAVDVRYYNMGNETEKEDYQPWIDICYKKVPVKKCDEDNGFVEKLVPVISSVVLVENEDEGRTNETLTHGTDNDGKKYRTVLKFDLTDFSENFKNYELDDSFIHLNYLGPSDQYSPTTRTVQVKRITKDWDEDTITWDTLEYEDEPAGELVIEESRLGGTLVTILISDLVKNWVDAGTTNNYGVVLIDKNEDSQSSVPIYAHDDTEKYNYSPELAICQKKSYNPTTSTPIITTTVPITSEIKTQTTPAIFQGQSCAAKNKEPVEKLKVWVVNNTVVVDPDDYDEEDRTLCVSTAEIAIKFCWDIEGKCKKYQRRDIYGKVETSCNCCLPVIKEVDTHTFDCFGEIAPRRLKIKMIETCKCHICARDSESGNSNGMEIVDSNDILPNKREAALLSL